MKNDLIYNEELLSKNIKQARLDKGITQTELAEIVGAKQQNIQEWETGKRGLTAKYLLMFAKIFGEEIFRDVVMTEYEKNIQAIERNKSREYVFKVGNSNLRVHSFNTGIHVNQGLHASTPLGTFTWSEKREQQLLDGIDPVTAGWKDIHGKPIELADMSSLI